MKSRMMREKVREAMLSSVWRKRFMQALVAILLFSTIAAAQEKPAVGDQTEDLQKSTQNPVASLISVPLQNNTNFGVNPGYRNQDVSFQFPTATNRYLGQGKLGAGPSIVALTQPGHWTLGVLANNVWSVAGSGSRPDVNQFLMQCFINYNLQKGWFIALSPIITANWEASRGNVWTGPFGGGIGRITKFRAQPRT